MDHWGSLFGDKLTADHDVTRTPQSFTFPASVVQVGTSNSTQYALLSDGSVWAWGQGTNGELGNGTDKNSFTAPVQVRFPARVRIAFLATHGMPFDTALAVDTNGNAWGWGLNREGELCLGNTTGYNTPRELPLADVTTLAGADQHAVYDAGGTVYSCGANDYGVAGIGSHSRAPSLTPQPVHKLPPGVAVTSLLAGYNNDGALLADGRYYDWGYNYSGQDGDGKAPQPALAPVRVVIPDTSPVSQVALGGSTTRDGQTLVMLADGTIWAWGNDTWGQLGDDSTANEATPIQITPPQGVTYAALATGGGTSYAIDTNRNVWAWGNGKTGQLGIGKTSESKVPVQADSGARIISSTAGDVVVAR